MSLNNYCQSIIKTAIFLFILSLISSALLFIYGRYQSWKEVPENYKQFLKQSFTDQEREFAKLPIEKQYEFYIYGMTKVHPPLPGFAYDIVDTNGEKAIPFLINKLKTEKDEFKQQAIIHVFKAIAMRNCNLKDNNELIRLIEKTVSLMKDRSNIENSEQSLKIIMGQTSK